MKISKMVLVPIALLILVALLIGGCSIAPSFVANLGFPPQMAPADSIQMQPILEHLLLAAGWLSNRFAGQELGYYADFPSPGICARASNSLMGPILTPIQ